MSLMRARIIAGLILAASVTAVRANDWPEWRGARRDGTSAETNLPSRWSPAGENVAWSLPFGGRSAPVVFGNHVYLQTITMDSLATTQERLVAIDADSGKMLWKLDLGIEERQSSPTYGDGKLYVPGGGTHEGFGASAKLEILNGVLRVEWILGDGARLRMLAHFGAEPATVPPLLGGEVVYADGVGPAENAGVRLEPGAVHVLLAPPDA